MPAFGSDRERRLWIWTSSVVAAIYLTLGVAGQLSAELRDRGLLDGIFVLGFVLAVVAVATKALRSRPGGIEITVLAGVAAAYLMAFARLGIPDERTHLFEYSVVAVLMHEALTERAASGRRVPRPALIAFVATAALGVIDECIQALLPNRVFDVRDIGFNVLAAFLAVVASAVLSRPRHHGSTTGPSSGRLDS